jgi:hypothetical protein
MRSLVSTILVRVTWALTVVALLALSVSAGLFDLSRPARAATAALESPAGQRLASDFIADQLQAAVPGLSDRKAHQLATKVASDPDTLTALRRADLKGSSGPQDRAALLTVVASHLKETDPRVAAATRKYAGRVRATAPDEQAQPPSPVGGLLKRLQQFVDGTGSRSDAAAVMSDLKERLAHLARVLGLLAGLTAALALLVASDRGRVVRSFGWMLIGVSLIPAAIGKLVPDLVLAKMSSDWAQALAVGLRVGGGRLIGLFVTLLVAGIALLALGLLWPRLGALLSPAPGAAGPARGPAERPRPQPRFDDRSPFDDRPPFDDRRRFDDRPGPAEDLAVTRPIEVVPGRPEDPGHAAPPTGYQYPDPYPGGHPQYPPYPGRRSDENPYDDRHDPYGPAGDDRRR